MDWRVGLFGLVWALGLGPASLVMAQEAPPTLIIQSGMFWQHPGVGLGIDPAGNLYVADDTAGGFLVYDPLVTTFSKWAGRGTSFPPFGNLVDIAFTRFGDFFVLSSNGVEHFDALRNRLAVFGSPGTGPGQLQSATAAATDWHGNVYVADGPTARVQKFSPGGTFLQEWRLTGGPSAPAAVGVDVGAGGKVFILDGTNHRIQVFSASGSLMHQWGGFGSEPGQMNGPEGVTIDESGGVYVAERGSRRVQKFLPDGTLLSTWTLAAAPPTDICVGPRGRIYVVGTGSSGNNGFIYGYQYAATPVFQTSWGRIKHRYR